MELKRILDVRTRQESCAKHGAFDAKNFIGDIWTKCPRCVDELDAAELEQREIAERDTRASAWTREIGESGIPRRFQTRTLESFAADTPEKRRALSSATRFADEFSDALKTGRSALFVGNPGTGKTHLACGVGLRLMQRERRTVLFSSVFRLVNRVMDTYGRGATETRGQVVGRFVVADLLILDEVGMQRGTDEESRILFDILNDRYENYRPVILISNLNIDGVRAYLGDRIWDRLREGGGTVVPFGWESYRGKESA